MRTQWSPEALADLAGIVRYVREDNPSAVERVRRTIRRGISILRDFPPWAVPGASSTVAN